MKRQFTVLALAAVLAWTNTSAIAQIKTTPSQSSPHLPVVVDPKILALLNSVQTNLKSVHSISARANKVFTWSSTGPDTPSPIHQVVDIKLLRPNYASINIWNLELSSANRKWHRSKPEVIQIADGKYYWFWLASLNQYGKSAAGPSGSNIELATIDYLGGFFTDKSPMVSEITRMNADHTLTAATLKDNQFWNGANYKVVEISFGGSVTQALYIGDDRIIHRITTTSRMAKDKHRMTVTEDDILDTFKLDPQLDKSIFKFASPTGSTPIDETPPTTGHPELKN